MPHSLNEFIDEVAHDGALRVESDLGSGFVRLRVTEAQRRQAAQDIRCVEDAVVEMLRNARDAGARALFLATAKSGPMRTVVLVDTGNGIPAHLTETVFEPRVTSKLDSMSEDAWGVHGRGMALFSIRENAERARVAATVEGKGCSIAATFDTTATPERRDQSTLSPLVKDEAGKWSVGAGPHNIARIAEQFALDHRASLTLYFGSPVEIAATLCAFGRQTLSTAERSAATPAQLVAPAKRLAKAQDASQFALLAAELGLDISPRSAHRIIQGQIKPLPPFLDTLKREGGACAKRELDVARDFRGLKIAPDDLRSFSAALGAAYAELADRYYLEPQVEPRIRVGSDGITVTFPVAKQ